MAISPFDVTGNLPLGIHWATWEELVQRFGSNDHRRRLLEGLRAALVSLRAASCQTVYIDGSFVTAKEIPNDFDCCWDIVGVNPALLDPVLLHLRNGRRAQKAKYMGDLFPAQIRDVNTGSTFIDFFQVDKEGNQKGIIAINLGDPL